MAQFTQKRSTFILACVVYLASHNTLGNEITDPETIRHCGLNTPKLSLKPEPIAAALGWQIDESNFCGGFYHEDAFPYDAALLKNRLTSITSQGTLFSQQGTSILQGGVTLTQEGQQIKADRACLYRDPVTHKIIGLDLVGNIHIREPNNLLVARTGHFDFNGKQQSLTDISYRMAVYGANHQPLVLNNAALQKARDVTQLSAWGTAKTYRKRRSQIYHLTNASFSTCPPTAIAWQLKGSDIVLNKKTGRGTARNSTMYLYNVPVLYTPFLNFPIDRRRQTGLLFPYFGASNKLGPYLGTPFYWNLAPNYDMTITPLFMGKRGVQVRDLFRYLTSTNSGKFDVSFNPKDKFFSHFQTESIGQFKNNTDAYVQANLNRLKNAGASRGSFAWQDNAQYSANWSSNIDVNYISDDYYLRDYGHTLNEITENQLLQKGEILYKSPHWNFSGKLQQYETLHPVDTNSIYLNQYARLPQLTLEGDYPDSLFGLSYNAVTELTHFDMRNMPGAINAIPLGGLSSAAINPVGNRLHFQPGVSINIAQPAFYITPRAQLFLSTYQLRNNSAQMPSQSTLAVPVFDVAAGLYFDRESTLFHYAFKQTLEPQIYYTYVPYRDQTRYPVFDTTLNNQTYDQLFLNNRFSGYDRIGDANQMSIGLTSRIMDSFSGIERVRIGLGEIMYFRNRRVTVCTVDDPNCLNPDAVRSNSLRRSAVAGVLNYHVNDTWSLIDNLIWNSQLNQVDNHTIALQYHPAPLKVINIAYNFVRNGDPQLGLPPNNSGNNLKQIDIGFGWPLSTHVSIIGRWTKSVNQAHFQNLIYGLQYDSCCWAVRFAGGRTFTNLNTHGQPIYETQAYLQFSLKGLGNIGTGDPSQYISTNIGGYTPNFGQDY